jgi:hypothetical protein
MRPLDAQALLLMSWIALFQWSQPAVAHSFYDAACCSDRDCAPVHFSTIRERPEGFYVLPQGDFIERGKEKYSPDGDWHVCRSETSGKLLCIYVPGRGS